MRQWSPIVGTGMEYRAARDPVCRRRGEVDSLSSVIVITTGTLEQDVYCLSKYRRSKQEIGNQFAGQGRMGRGEIIADGAPT